MSCKLLWHTGVYPDGTPISGLCEFNSDKLIFMTEYSTSYNTSIFHLYLISKEDLNRAEEHHLRSRSIIGGINDYGENFKLRPDYTNIFNRVVKPPSLIKGDHVCTIRYSDIINPYQYN